MWDGLRGGKGDLREKHGGGLGVGETEGRERGDKGGGRTWNHTTIYVRGEAMMMVYLWLAGTAGGGWSITWRAWGIFGEEYVLFVTDEYVLFVTDV